MKHYIIYTDGAASGNPGPGGWGCVILEKISSHLKEIGGWEEHTTNNRMELLALQESLKLLLGQKAEVHFFIDSQYVLNGIQKWVYQWEKNGFKTKEGKDVQHKDLWLNLLNEIRSPQGKELKIKWNFVKGHSNSLGNERADQIAVGFSKYKNCDLFEGNYRDYPYDLLKKNNPFKVYYLALHENKLNKFDTWAECERFIQGKQKIKYKKISNELEEKTILSSWGMDSVNENVS